MHGTVTGSGNAAINAKDRSVCEPGTSDISVDDGCGWFVRAAPALLAPKPGFILHLETDCGERNGDRYTSGAVKVPSNVVRHLLRGKHGRQWLNVIMEGSDAEWWVEHHGDEKVARAVRAALE